MTAKNDIERRLNFMSSLDRTNTRLTTSIKFVYDVVNRVFRFGTIKSSETQNDTRLEDRFINTNLSLGSNIRNLVSSFDSTEFLYDVKSDPIDSTRKLKDQIYQENMYGCTTANSGNRIFSLFAPLNIRDTDIPDFFVIYRNTNNSDIRDLKTYTPLYIVDLREDTDIGSYLRSYINTFSSEQCISIDYSTSTIRYFGMNITTGEFEEVKEDITPLLANERTVTEVDNYITNGFKRHNLMYNRIINLQFDFDDSSQGFKEYVGIYTTSNEISEYVAEENFDNYNIIVKETADDLFVVTDKSDTEESYTKKKVISKTLVSSNSIYAARCRMRLKVLPKLFSHFRIIYNNNTEIDILWNSTSIKNTKQETLAYLAEQIVILSREAINISVTANIDSDGYLVVTSNSSSPVFEGIYIEDNNAYEFDTAVSSDTSLEPGAFNGIKEQQTLLFSTYFNTETLKYVEYTDNNGDNIIANVYKSFTYGIFFAVELSTKVDIDTTKKTVWLYEDIKDILYQCPIVEHRILDSTVSDKDKYDKPYDFDLDRYKKYLLEEIADPDFLGRLPEGTSESEIQEYKSELIKSIKLYFNNIVYSDDIIITDVDPIDNSVTYGDSEYDRFSEEQLLELQTNKISGAINKFKIYDSENGINTDDRINISLQFTSSNLTPNTRVAGRDIQTLSHSYFIIGEGYPPYVNNTLDDIKLLSGYSKERIESTELLDTETDVYESKLKYTFNSVEMPLYSYVNYEEDYDRCNVSFHGVMYFLDKRFSGYRFSVVLRSSVALENDIEYELYENDTFKTLTLFVLFSIPDPILTSLERGDDYYFLDRSLVYFSREILSTDTNLISFGERELSLDLYNSTTEKFFNTINTGTDWIYQTEEERYMYIGRGFMSRFNTNFKEIFYVGEDFVYYYGDNTNMVFTIKSISTVSEDYLWCKDLEIHLYDDNGLLLESASVFDIYDTDLLLNNNLTFIAQAISKELAMYDKYIRSVANEIRFNTLSAAGLKGLIDFNDNDIHIFSTKELNSDYVDVFIQNMDKTSVYISKDFESLSLINKETPFVTSMLRRSGDIEVITKPAVLYKSDTSTKNISIESTIDYKTYERKVGKVKYTNNKPRNSVVNGDLAIYERYNSVVKNRSSYTFKKNTDNTAQTDIEWIYNNIEIKGLNSIAFSYPRMFECTMLGSDSITKSLQSHFYSILPKYTVDDIDNNKKLDILNIEIDLTINRLNDINFKNEIDRRFIDQYVLSEYVPTIVVDSSGTKQDFRYDTNNRVLIITDVDTTEKYTVTLTSGAS